ncbi:Ribosomal_S21 domain-containing protein [Cinnamomum micranthum f. kanehirae]|uniref:Ribosomal_S21 domain-containing protein n=1 Tax=Cinnamomum micranthum f. kanehirae TaxID=337451 RepID=A0A3S3QEH4_9MAGN|nr:Ribosomal_S21 domain-containing protein [Cinnamomum micranthum f. kanehirae]
MSAVTRQLWKGATSLFGGYSPTSTSTSVVGSSSSIIIMHHQVQWCRGIRVRVWNGNLEQALAVMARKMVSSGIERLIKRQPTRHIKNSEKRVLARKNLEHRIRSQDLARKLRSILIKKVRGL